LFVIRLKTKRPLTYTKADEMDSTRRAQATFNRETHRQERTKAREAAKTPPEMAGRSHRTKLLRRGVMYA